MCVLFWSFLMFALWLGFVPCGASCDQLAGLRSHTALSQPRPLVATFTCLMRLWSFQSICVSGLPHVCKFFPVKPVHQEQAFYIHCLQRHGRLWGLQEMKRGICWKRVLGWKFKDQINCFCPGDVLKWKPPEVLQIQSESRWKMPLKVREAVLERDGRCCWYCRVKIEENSDGLTDGLALTVDHWIPLCRGGTNAMVNLVCACSRCNELKGNCMPDDFQGTARSASSTWGYWKDTWNECNWVV